MNTQSEHGKEAIRLNAIDIINETPDLTMLMFGMDDENAQRVLDYVMGVIAECVKLGQAEIMIFGGDDGLIGYLTLFKFSKMGGISVDYVERLLVMEKYRGLGIGTQLMNAAMQKSKHLSLISKDECVGFYEKLGFKTYAESSTGLPVMRNHDKDERVEFGLNKNDIDNILKLIK